MPTIDLPSVEKVAWGNVDGAIEDQTDLLEALALREEIINKVNKFQETPDDDHYPSEKLIADSLDDKSDNDHQHAFGDLMSIPEAFTPDSHTHVIGDVDALDEALSGLAPSEHTHIIGDIDALTEAFGGFVLSVDMQTVMAETIAAISAATLVNDTDVIGYIKTAGGLLQSVTAAVLKAYTNEV